MSVATKPRPKFLNGKPWSNEEIKFVLSNYGPMTAAQIGKQIGRTAEAVRVYVKRYDEMRGAR